jgi:hypothetical protein
MNAPEDKDRMDALLHEQNAYVDDGGFTSRVMAALPPRHPMSGCRHSWLSPALLLGAAVVGTELAVRWLPWANLPPLNLSALLSLDSQVMAPWVSVLLVVACVVWTVTAAVQCDD